MKKSILISIILLLTGCVSEGIRHEASAPQYHEHIKITGDLLTPYKINEVTGRLEYQRHLIVNFDDITVIDGYLTSPAAIQGELSGEYKGKKVTSVCNSAQTSETNIKVDCMILIDNERTVTLTF